MTQTITHAGTDKDRQERGLPGHCDDCVDLGHVIAHPDMGCGDVGCGRYHLEKEETPVEDERPGEIKMTRRMGGIKILEAPKIALVSLELLSSACDHAIDVCRDEILFADQVLYRVVGVEGRGDLRLELLEDRREPEEPAASQMSGAPQMSVVDRAKTMRPDPFTTDQIDNIANKIIGTSHDPYVSMMDIAYFLDACFENFQDGAMHILTSLIHRHCFYRFPDVEALDPEGKGAMAVAGRLLTFAANNLRPTPTRVFGTTSEDRVTTDDLVEGVQKLIGGVVINSIGSGEWLTPEQVAERLGLDAQGSEQ